MFVLTFILHFYCEMVRTPTTLDAHRATFVARLEMLRTERAELLLEELSLGKEKKDGKRKDAIQLGSDRRDRRSDRRHTGLPGGLS